jgi:hypothetical protein
MVQRKKEETGARETERRDEREKETKIKRNSMDKETKKDVMEK